MFRGLFCLCLISVMWTELISCLVLRWDLNSWQDIKSHLNTKEDILEVRQILNEHGSKMKIIAKIENMQGIENLEEILSVSDGVMVARGDMGVEIPMEEVPVMQKKMIKMAVAQGKHVITATQMLESMIKNPRPTRAEATDIANAIYDGTTAIMLSGESAAGLYPIEAVKTMAE